MRKTFSLALAAAALVAATVPTAASAGNQCDLKWYDDDPVPHLVC